jgi:hypothetical protein
VSTDWVVTERSDNFFTDLMKTLGDTSIVSTLLELNVQEHLENLESINKLFNQANVFDNSKNTISN